MADGLNAVQETKAKLVRHYAKKPDEVAGLRQICVAWQREFNFWSFDETLPVLARSGSLVFYVPMTSDRDPKGTQWDGALLVDLGPYEADILFIYVRPERRREQLALAMFRELVEHVKKIPQIESIFLDVRVSNQSAISLYDKLGMKRVRVRKKYYASNGEDALVYGLTIDRSTEKKPN